VVIEHKGKLVTKTLLDAISLSLEKDDEDTVGKLVAQDYFAKVMVYQNKCTQMKMLYLANVKKDYQASI